ncbi:hypothetical protein [Pseudozobellia sp. WGM2]|uniref:hypothetical protein n=1 Tax=Pseudozobellia sp. WGM2 TaxID=2787625 RepID=UPI001ADF4833|nr:hypothetical protein [Pseudozobellia sp. WGM2]
MENKIIVKYAVKNLVCVIFYFTKGLYEVMRLHFGCRTVSYVKKKNTKEHTRLHIALVPLAQSSEK